MPVRELLPLLVVREPIRPLRLAVLLFLLLPKPLDFRRTNWPRIGIPGATGEMWFDPLSTPLRVMVNQGFLQVPEDNEDDARIGSSRRCLRGRLPQHCRRADNKSWRNSKVKQADRSHRTIDREVANPFRMLSEYLMAIAVTRPPITWIATVAQAHAPKWRNKSRKGPRESGEGLRRG